MNTLYSALIEEQPLRAVLSFVYPDTGEQLPQIDHAEQAARRQEEIEAAKREVEQRVAQARAEAVTETERRVRAEYDARLHESRAQVQEAIEAFRQERKNYFDRAEAEVVRLALSIAARILHREAQVDPMMVAALVQLAVERMDAGTQVTARVPVADAEKWSTFFRETGGAITVNVMEDASLAPAACILQTELGDTDFSIDAQLKEVESGFFDLLAQRPEAK